MGRYNEGQPITPAEEIRFYLDNANAVDEESSEQENRENERLEEIADENMRSHSDALTIIMLAFVMIFFGTVFTALSDHQDYTEREKLSAERLVSGRIFSEAEKKFNESLPLQDYFHNAQSAIKYCFGIGNTTDFIDIESKRLADDPYRVDPVDDGYTPVKESEGDQGDSDAELDGNKEKTLPAVETTDNGKNKKIKGITLTTLKNEDELLADNFAPITVDREPPHVTNNGFSPYNRDTETTPEETQTQPSDQQSETPTTTTKNFFYDPNAPRTTPSETAPPEENTGSDTQSGDPSQSEQPQESETQSSSATRPPQTTNKYLVPAR